MLDPRHNKYLGSWDILTMVMLLFVAIGEWTPQLRSLTPLLPWRPCLSFRPTFLIFDLFYLLLFSRAVTPFEVAFLESPRDVADIGQRFGSVGWLWVTNRIVDLIFTIDIVLQFRLMYQASDTAYGTRWVRDATEIVWHYLTHWFLLDFLSVAVALFDIIPVVNGSGSDNVGSLRSLRMMRILRLIKLVRLLRASRLFQRWETKVAINYSSLNISRSVGNVVLISHWFACLWGLQVALADRKVGTWVDFFGYCTPVEEYTGDKEFITAQPGDCVTDGPWALYSASVYWAVMTITSIGYGDIHATDRNVSEQVMNTFLMLLGAISWGHVIGTFCGVVATMSPHVTEFNRRMDDLNRYMSMNNLDQDLKRRLREYLHQTKHLQIAAASKDLLGLLSPALQGEVTWAVNRKWLERVVFFKDTEPEFLVQIAMSLSPLVLTPGELAISGYLYIVHRGIALYGGRVLTSGKIWGEDCIMQNSHLQRRWCARAMNYLEVYLISRDDVLDIAASFPKTLRVIRRLAIRMAARRQFILAAKLMAAQQGLAFGSGGSTFDRLLDQATSVPISQLKLQNALTTNRLETGGNSGLHKGRNQNGDEESAMSRSPLIEASASDTPDPPPVGLRTSYGSSKSGKGGASGGLSAATLTRGQAMAEAEQYSGTTLRPDVEQAAHLLQSMPSMGSDNKAARGGTAMSSTDLNDMKEELAATKAQLSGKFVALDGKVDGLSAQLAALASQMEILVAKLN